MDSKLGLTCKTNQAFMFPSSLTLILVMQKAHLKQQQ